MPKAGKTLSNNVIRTMEGRSTSDTSRFNTITETYKTAGYSEFEFVDKEGIIERVTLSQNISDKRWYWEQDARTHGGYERYKRDALKDMRRTLLGER